VSRTKGGAVILERSPRMVEMDFESISGQPRVGGNEQSVSY
jgi:hypothetical protein